MKIRGSRFNGRAVAALVTGSVLLLWSPILSTLAAVGIPAFAPSALQLLSAIAAIGLVPALVAAATLPGEDAGRVKRAVFVAALVGIVLAALDIGVGGFSILNALTPELGADAMRRPLRLSVLVVLGGVAFIILWQIQRHAAALVCIVGSAFFVSTVATNPSLFLGAPFTTVDRPSSPSKDLPVIVYVVLDEAMGLAGLNAAPGGEGTATTIREVLDRHGFLVYPNAFSRHFVSSRSIPNTINFDFEDDSYGPALRYQTDLKVHSRLFDGLVDDGYEVVSYGTPHIDFCFERATRCEVLPSFNPFSALITDFSRRTGSFLLTMRQARTTSYIVYAYTVLAERLSGEALPPTAAIDAYALPRWFDRFSADVASSPRGRAYFAHILGPHSPYVLAGDCAGTGQFDVPYFLTEQHALSGEELDIARSNHYRSYYQQYECVIRKLDVLLTTLNEIDGFRDATVVVHGDHGARISAGQYFENLSERDFVDNYSTLFAIKRPSLAPGQNDRAVSVQRLIAEYFGPGRVDDLPADTTTVAVDTGSYDKVVVHDVAALFSKPPTQ